ncbi:MAG: phosphoenolpyruvate synthase [Chloroflexi bacterium]|nr:MAG: phosphoenolpyruvate synthase [Chloroflexota bacterium]
MQAVIRFGEASCEDVAIAGGKGASLSRMVRAGLPVPPGFVVTTAAFTQCLAQQPHIEAQMADLLNGIDAEDERNLTEVAEQIRRLILELPLPEHLAREITTAYASLGDAPRVAVRSSAAAEDSATASFAGQQETYLNVQAGELLDCVRACWASFFSPRALFYRRHKGNLNDTTMAVVVQQMIVPEKSGVLFTVHPVYGRTDQIVIESVWGLGESVVAGKVTPDHYVVDKATGEVVTAVVAPQPIAIVPDEAGGGVREVELTPEQATSRVLSDSELAELAGLGRRLEEHFGRPQDVEWGIAGGQVYLLQSRPVTTL